MPTVTPPTPTVNGPAPAAPAAPAAYIIGHDGRFLPVTDARPAAPGDVLLDEDRLYRLVVGRKHPHLHLVRQGATMADLMRAARGEG